MKTRNGFVSNSSSSSFCVYGVSIGDDEIQELGLKYALIEKSDDEEGYESIEAYDLQEIAENKGLTFGAYDDEAWLGLMPDEIGDDETGKEFKERVKKLVAEFLGDDIMKKVCEFDWIIEEVEG